MVSLIRLFRGYVIFSVTGSYPERFVNILICSGINVWGVRSRDGVVYCCARASDYRFIRKLRRRTGSKIHVERKRGLPFLIHRNRERVGLLVGVFCFIAVFKILSLFVWNVDLYGFENMSYNHAKDVMEKVGVYEGAYGKYESLKNIQTRALIEFESVSWITVNVDGSQGEVNISEVTEKNKSNDEKSYNIKADIDAQIIRVDAYSGLSVVKSGDAVVRGNLLISGFVETELGGTHLDTAEGVVWARTERTERFSVPKNAGVTEYDPDFRNRYSCRIFGFVVPLTFSDYGKSGNYFTFLNEKKASFNDRNASVSVIGENVYFYGEKEDNFDEGEAESIFNAEVLLGELFNYGDKKIVERTVKRSDDRENFYFDVKYICEEDIGVKSEIILDDNFSIDTNTEFDEEVTE